MPASSCDGDVSRKPRQTSGMLTGLFHCFRGAEESASASHEAPKQSAGRGRRDHSGPFHFFKLRPDVSYRIESSSSSCSATQVSSPNDAGYKPPWASSNTATSSTSVPTDDATQGLKDDVGLQAGSCLNSVNLPAISTLTGAGRTFDSQARTPSPAMLLSLRNLHMAIMPVDYMQQQSPFTNDSPCGEVRPASIDFVGLGFGDLTTSDSSGAISVPNLHQQLRFMNACRLGEEVQDLQILGRGGYGMVMTGNWKQEGRVAVKVLLSDEDKWMESCYKEAVLSKVLAHPNILQTYDFQVAVLSPSDVARAKISWQQHQRPQSDLLSSSASRLPYITDLRADSFELLPPLGPTLNAAGMPRTGVTSTSVDLWQVLFMLGAKPGQFVTLIIMEYAEVGTLQRAIAAGAFRESARLSKWAALRSLLVTAKEIAGGMCLLHSYKIIHGDLSATNVMLRCSRIDKRGFVAKVADFGLSKVTLSGVAKTGDWAGQAQYMAPECLDYESRLASDVFAFGVLLYEMATGKKAFGEYQPAQILAGRLAGDLELEWPQDAPPELRSLAERCMQQDPEARPSFREVVEDLRRQDTDAKALHRQHSLQRRYTADGQGAAMLAAAAALSAAAAAAGCSGRTPSPLGPHRTAVPSPYLMQAVGSGISAGGFPPATLASVPSEMPRMRAPSSEFAAAASYGMVSYGVSRAAASAFAQPGPLRHSFTTGSYGMAVGLVAPTAVAASAAEASDFTATWLPSVSSRVFLSHSSEASGRLSSVPCMAPVPAPAPVPWPPALVPAPGPAPPVFVPVERALQLEPIASGEIHQAVVSEALERKVSRRSMDEQG